MFVRIRVVPFNPTARCFRCIVTTEIVILLTVVFLATSSVVRLRN
jgi:hypothetical protein